MFKQMTQVSIRFTLCVTAIFMIVLCWQQTEAAAEELNPITVTLDLENVEFMVDPVIRNPGITLVPFRALFEALGMEVDWEPTQRLVTGENDKMSISLIIGENKATVNNQTYELERAPELIEGNTMIPIRFVAESTGASVFWDPYDRMIIIITIDYMEANHLTREQVEEAINEYLTMRAEEAIEEDNDESDESDKPEETILADPVKPVDLNHLEGMYYGFRGDYGGYECGGICWDFYTFLPNNQVFIGTPENGGPETINCAAEQCFDYSISSGQLKLSNGESLSIEKSERGFLMINDVRLDAVLPAPEDMTLDNKYKYLGYTGLIGITGAASSWTYHLTLNPDKTFVLSGVSLGSLGATSPYGPTTEAVIEDDDVIGTYEIDGNTITMTNQNGIVTNELFFVHNESTEGIYEDIQVGSRNYYFETDY